LNREDAALLALLALDGASARARIVALLWPQADEQTARNTLRQHLLRLRRTAGELVAGQELLSLRAGLAHDLDDPHEPLAADVGARTGDVLAAHLHDDLPAFAAWLETARAQWRARRGDALARIAQEHEASGRLAQALTYAHRLAAEEPLAEHAQRRVMRLHYRRGDRSAALAAFESYRTALDVQLGETPSSETRALVSLIEAGGRLPDGPGPVETHLPSPVVLLRPPRLVGRDAQWRLLQAAWRSGTPTIVAGDPGVGKSRLVSDFAASQPGCAIVRMRPGDDSVRYLLLGRLLRLACAAPVDAWAEDAAWARAELARIVPEWGAPAPGAVDPLRLLAALEQALGAAGCRWFVIDDLQWADAASLQMLPALWAVQGMRCVMAVRLAEAPQVAAAWACVMNTRELGQIGLEPLDLQGVAALLDSLALPGFEAAAWAVKLHRHTGGNPMFILETLLDLVRRNGAAVKAQEDLPLPPTVLASIQSRLEQLSPAALKLARVAAVAGRDFSADLAARVLAMPVMDLVTGWRELEQAHVITDTAFTHDLVFEAVLRGVPAALRRWLHGEVAAALQQMGPAAAERVALHWLEAKVWDKAGQACTAAAKQAYDASRYGDAVGHFESAALCHERQGDRAAQQRAMQELIGCHIKHHDLASARHWAMRLRTLAADSTQAAWALDRMADIANMGRDDVLAESVAREMLKLGQRVEDGDSAGWISFNGARKLAVALAHQGRCDESLALFETHREWIAARASEWNVHVWLADRGYVLDLADRRDEALAAHDAAARCARKHENWYVVYAAMRNRALSRYWHGELAAAIDDAEDALRLTDRIGDPGVRGNPREAARRAVLLRESGRHGDSLRLLEQAVATLSLGHSPFWLAYCQDQLALGYLAVGQHARAWALVQADPGCDTVEAHATRRLARARCQREYAAAPAAWARPDAMYARADCPARWRLLADLEASRGAAPGQARAAAQRVVAEAVERGLGGIALHARLLEACAAIRCHDADLGLAALHAALDEFQAGRHPTGMAVLDFQWLGVQALDALGDPQAANEVLHAALRRIDDVELPGVPPAFRSSFRERHPVHQRLLAAASRL